MWSISRLSTGAPHYVRVLLDVNPAAVYMDLVRYGLISSFTSEQLPPHVWPLALFWAVFVGAGGFVYFWKAEERYGRG
jgi:teichoic acid transport system permease protein